MAHLWAIPTHDVSLLHGLWAVGTRPRHGALKFVEAIENGRTIDIYNHGKMERDFTYIEISSRRSVG